jgi:hypothetical protein
MVCDHLKPLEQALLGRGFRATYRGQVWTKNCREWVYFDVVFDIANIQQCFALPDCVRIHENLDCKSGTERGFECTSCRDAVMGLLDGAPSFP